MQFSIYACESDWPPSAKAQKMQVGSLLLPRCVVCRSIKKGKKSSSHKLMDSWYFAVGSVFTAVWDITVWDLLFLAFLASGGQIEQLSSLAASVTNTLFPSAKSNRARKHHSQSKQPLAGTAQRISASSCWGMETSGLWPWQSFPEFLWWKKQSNTRNLPTAGNMSQHVATCRNTLDWAYVVG